MINIKHVKIWLAISKKEYRIFTFRFGKMRNPFFLILFLGLIFWGFFLGPLILSAIFPDVFRAWALEKKKKFGDLFGFFFVIVFFVNFLVPIYDSYRKSEVSLREIALSAPIEVKDILFADFVWRIPIYVFMVLIIGPLFASMLSLVKTILLLDLILIYASLFAVFILSMLLGEIVLNFVEKTVIESSKLKKSRAYYIFLISFLIIGIIYLFQFVLLFLLNTPQFNLLLLFFPSFWYSNIIVYSIDKQLLLLPEINFWVSLGLAVIIPITIIYIFYKGLEDVAILDEGDQDYKDILTPNDVLYRMIKKLTVLRWEPLVLSKFKIFFRDRENTMKTVFTLCTILLTGFVMLLSFHELKDYLLREHSQTLILHTYRETVILMVSWLSSLLFTVLWGSYSFIESKEVVFMYRKSPRGIKTLIISHLYSQILILVFMDILITAIISLMFLFNIFQIIALFTIFFVHNAIAILQGIGLQCFNPLYRYKKKIVFINIYYILAFQTLSLTIIIVLIFPSLPRNYPYVSALNIILFRNLILLGLITPIFLLLGFIKLKTLQ